MSKAPSAQVKPSLLLVEDDDYARRPLEMLLNRNGFKVTSVPTLQEAFDCLTDGTEFIVLDLMLPDGNGIDLLRHIRNVNHSARVVVVTGTGDENVLDSVRSLNPTALLSKPLSLHNLLTYLRE